MRMIEPITVTPGMLTSTTVPEADHPVWVAGTTYANGARVIHERAIYESVQAGNTGRNPAADTLSEWWVRVGATNRWRAFDNALTPGTALTADITYVLTLTGRVDSVALFGLIGTGVRIACTDGGGVVQYDQTFALASARQVDSWWDWFFEPFAVSESLIVNDLPAYTGWALTITVRGAGAGTRAVGEILIGRNVILGTSLEGTEPGFRDYSVREQDQWGEWNIVRRGFSRTVDYRFALPQEDLSRVLKTVSRNRARLCVFSAGPGTDDLGTTLLGIINEDGISIPITAARCFATLSVTGVAEE